MFVCQCVFVISLDQSEIARVRSVIKCSPGVIIARVLLAGMNLRQQLVSPSQILMKFSNKTIDIPSYYEFRNDTHAEKKCIMVCSLSLCAL